MDQFDTFLKNLLKNPSINTTLEINGVQKNIKAMVHLTTLHYLNDGDYYKIIFSDDSFMLIIPGDKELYYAPKILGKIESITDEMIGNVEIINFNGREYKLEDKDEYQFVLKLLVGSPLDIEGECRFSDYLPTTGPKEFLSLGWISFTGERSDINCQIIDISQIKIIIN